MTDRPPSDSPPSDSRNSASAQPSRGVRSPKAGSGRRRSHPLLGLFPMTIMTVATFLVVFVLMMARLQAGADPALHFGVASALHQPAGSSASVTTRASTSAGATALAASQASPGRSRAIVTRTSPGAAGASHDD